MPATQELKHAGSCLSYMTCETLGRTDPYLVGRLFILFCLTPLGLQHGLGHGLLADTVWRLPQTRCGQLEQHPRLPNIMCLDFIFSSVIACWHSHTGLRLSSMLASFVGEIPLVFLWLFKPFPPGDLGFSVSFAQPPHTSPTWHWTLPLLPQLMEL